MRLAKYKQRAEKIYSFLNWRKKPMSRAEIINKFREDKLVHKGINTNERALTFLVEEKRLRRYFAKSGRLMFELNRGETNRKK